MGVSARLRWYAEALKDKEIRPVYLSGKRTLSISETNDEVVIHDSDSPGVKFSQAVFELVLDKTHSYRARQWITRDGQGSEEFSSAVTYTPRYHDVSSDSFFIVGGIIKFEEQGTLIAGTERDGTLTVHVEPTLIESGTFNCPKDYFSIDSLNIPKGTVISDSRVEPAVTFRYGESPLGDK